MPWQVDYPDQWEVYEELYREMQLYFHPEEVNEDAA